MRNLNFENRKINYDNLLKYGFVKTDNDYCYRKKILDGKFEVVVEILTDKKISYVLDIDNRGEYILVDIKTTLGEFASKIKEEYENVLNDIYNKCTTLDVFKSKQSKEIIKYIEEKYNDTLEFLWEKFDKNAIWRNKKNNKWYGLLMTIQKNRLGIKSDELIEVLNIMYDKDKIDEIIDSKTIYPGYHMNKKSWISIPLDDRLDIKYIKELIDNSYNISIKK